MSDLRFQIGDRVRLTREGVSLYGGVWPVFIPEMQGGGTVGTVTVAGGRPHDPRAAARPYYVQWENGVGNSYREEDLEGAEEPAVESKPGGQIVPFRRS